MTSRQAYMVGLLVVAVVIGCGRKQAPHSHADEGWAVTSWGDVFEVFAEADPLVVGETAKSHTHVTILDGFKPLTKGTVSAVLRTEDGTETAFTRDQALRPGIYSIEITPHLGGVYDLIFRVETPQGSEDIPSGRVRVGVTTHGGLIEAPPYASEEVAGVAGGSPPVGFLKEQQWKTAFATEWAARGTVRETVGGTARIRAAVGGDVIISAPANGIISTDLKMHTGSDVRAGQELIRLQPRAAAEQSISELRSDLALARSNLDRIEKLFAAGAVTQAEVDAARSQVEGLKPLVESSSSSEGLIVSSPLTGRVADVWVRPGQSVDAGDSLLRVVKTSPLWVEVALDPAEADALKSGLQGFHVRIPGSNSGISYTSDDARLIALSPSLNATTGTVTGLLEIKNVDDRLRLGSVVEANIATTQTRDGVVIPSSSLVDDGGTSVVYIQIEGESFERREVQVLAREGELVLINGLTPGLRLVTVGGPMIRRASLLSSGGIEGHVH